MRTVRQQAGYAIATISILGLVAMSSAAVLVQESGVTEADSVEASLVRIRANWAAMGHLTYVISRARQDGACDTECSGADTTRSIAFGDYGKEIYNAVVAGLRINNGTQRRWQYTEIHEDHALDTQIATGNVGGSSDAKISFTVSFVNSNARLDFVDAISDRLKPFEATICTGLADAGDNCPTLVTNTDISGISRIEDFRIAR